MDYKRIIKQNLRMLDTLYGANERVGNCCSLYSVKRVTGNVPDCKKYEVRYRECKSGEFVLVYNENIQTMPLIKIYDDIVISSSGCYSVCFMKKEDAGKRYNRTVRVIE